MALSSLKLPLITSLAFVLLLLSGCEPSPGRVIEVMKWKSLDGSTVVEAQLHKEGAIGNPAGGEHIRIYCSSDRVKRLRLDHPHRIAQSYYVSRLGNIPKNQVTIHSNDVIYGVLKHDFFISFDGCVKVRRLQEEQVDGLRARRRTGQVASFTYFLDDPAVSIFKSAHICSNGNIVLRIDEAYIKDNEQLWVVSEDKALTWKLVERPGC